MGGKGWVLEGCCPWIETQQESAALILSYLLRWWPDHLSSGRQSRAETEHTSYVKAFNLPLYQLKWVPFIPALQHPSLINSHEPYGMLSSLSPAVLYQILQHLFSLFMQLQDDTMHGCFLLALCIGAVSMSDISVLLKEQFTQKWNSVNKYSPSCCSPHYISGASQQNSAAAFSETTEVLRDFFIHTLVVTNLSIKHHTLQFSSLLWLLCLEQVFQYHSN